MEVCTIGGFNEVGKNMTAVKFKDDVFIFDVGLYIPGIVELQEESLIEYTPYTKKGLPKKTNSYPEQKLREFGAIPDDTVLDRIGWRNKVRAIFISHAHLDHVGGLPYLIHRYPGVPVFATPFTIKVLKAILEDEKIKFTNLLKTIHSNSSYDIKGVSGNYKIEFVHATHSTLECAFVVLHSSEGIFFYGLDLKFDNNPLIGPPPNYKRLSELGKKNVKVLVLDALYSGIEKKPGSEAIAAHLVEEAISKIKYSKKAIFATTFASHIARLNSIVRFGKITKRKIVFIGRSLYKYVNSAIEVKKCPFKNDIQIVKYGNQIESFLKKVEKDRDKYFVVCTGHQAEQNSILDRIVRGEMAFKFREGDNLIFASSVIPDPVNIAARDKMDNKLRRIGVRLQTDIHVHGHGSREDMRDIIRILKPKNIIPAHGALHQTSHLIELSSELGYKLGESSHLTSNGKVLRF